MKCEGGAGSQTVSNPNLTAAVSNQPVEAEQDAEVVLSAKLTCDEPRGSNLYLGSEPEGLWHQWCKEPIVFVEKLLI